jgi:lysophospholipase L1-like esterase
MPFSVLFAALPRLFCGAMLVLALSGCGSEGSGAHSSENRVDQPSDNDNSQDVTEPVTVKLDVSRGGYVANLSATLYCGDGGSTCETKQRHAYAERLGAIARFGAKFNGWLDSPSSDSDRSLWVSEDITPQAAFSKVEKTDDIKMYCEDTGTAAFRTLHLGDSLTAGLLLGSANHRLALVSAAINYYERKADRNIQDPVIIAAAGIRTSGQIVQKSSPASDSADGLPADHFWQQNLDVLSFTPDDFDAIVVALGSNDLQDMFVGMSADSVVEQRIRPLLNWLGDRPVYWILPHYGRWPKEMQNIRFSSTSGGIDCRCDGAVLHTSAQCNIVGEMQSCAVDSQLQRKTIDTFRAIHSLREHIAALQDEYTNLIVVDPAEAITTASNDQYDLYATMTPAIDTVHFSPQGAEWYAWLHAWLGMHANSDCTMPGLPKWQMGAAETAMAAELRSDQ